MTNAAKQVKYYNHTITYRKGHAVTTYGNRAWEFNSLAECKRWIQILHN